MKKMITRRNFLKAAGVSAAALGLAACGGSSSSTASSAAASSTAASAAESWGDVKLTMWGAEEDQTMLREMADAFIEQNADTGPRGGKPAVHHPHGRGHPDHQAA